MAIWQSFGIMCIEETNFKNWDVKNKIAKFWFCCTIQEPYNFVISKLYRQNATFGRSGEKRFENRALCLEKLGIALLWLSPKNSLVTLKFLAKMHSADMEWNLLLFLLFCCFILPAYRRRNIFSSALTHVSMRMSVSEESRKTDEG